MCNSAVSDCCVDVVVPRHASYKVGGFSADSQDAFRDLRVSCKRAEESCKLVAQRRCLPLSTSLSSKDTLRNDVDHVVVLRTTWADVLEGQRASALLPEAGTAVKVE